MRILPCGHSALLVELADLAEVMAALPVVAALYGVVEAVPAARTILVRVLPGHLDPVRERLGQVGVEGGAAAAPSGEVEVPVTYDGADLKEVARLTGLGVDEVVAAHTGTPWRVAFGGFAPGFAYLVGGDPRLVVPRRATPRTRVPAGSVALAGEFSGVYPTASPGGWRLIGRTDVALFDPAADPPALLTPGTLVRFRALPPLVEPGRPPLVEPAGPPLVEPAVSALRERGVETDVGSPRTRPQGLQQRTLTLIRTRFPVLVTDRGRPGFASIGVGRSGAADLGAHDLGARLVGNDRGEAALEITLGDAEFLADGLLTCALTGAPTDAHVVGVDGTTRAVSDDTIFTLGDGERLVLGQGPTGLRSYLSIRGGVDVGPVLGSRSRDTLAGLGPEPLRAGDGVPIGAAQSGWIPPTDWAPRPGTDAVAVLEFTPGPRADWVAPLDGTTWTVTGDVDRVGMRLAGEPLRREVDGELPSEGVVRGAIQVPPSGEPVIFLADHPLTGGYPVAGVLTPASCDLAAQLRPGHRLGFAEAPRIVSPRG